LTTPILLSRSSSAVYFFFGFSSLITVLVCAVAMPETNGRSLEDIDRAFGEHSWMGALKRLGGRWGLGRNKRDEEGGIELAGMGSREGRRNIVVA
jgi:hypothetical protein